MNIPLGTNLVEITATDSANNISSCLTSVTLVDTIPPSFVYAFAQPDVLWPPNDRMVEVRVHALVRDAFGSATCKTTGITCNEAVNGKRTRDLSGDWQIVNDSTVRLRAERSGRGSGRNYSIALQATNESATSPQRSSTFLSPMTGEIKPVLRENSNELRLFAGRALSLQKGKEHE